MQTVSKFLIVLVMSVVAPIVSAADLARVQRCSDMATTYGLIYDDLAAAAAKNGTAGMVAEVEAMTGVNEVLGKTANVLIPLIDSGVSKAEIVRTVLTRCLSETK